MPTNWIGKSSELKLHCFCLFDAYNMPKDTYSAGWVEFLENNKGRGYMYLFLFIKFLTIKSSCNLTQDFLKT